MHLILSLILLMQLTTAPARRSPSDCSGATWSAQCQMGECRYYGSPAAGCASSGGCVNCYRGAGSAGDPVTSVLDPATQFAGRFEAFKWKSKGTVLAYQRFVLTDPGVLAKYGIGPGDIIRRINGGHVTVKRLENTLTMKLARGLRIEWYTPGVGVRHAKTITSRVR